MRQAPDACRIGRPTQGWIPVLSHASLTALLITNVDAELCMSMRADNALSSACASVAAESLVCLTQSSHYPAPGDLVLALEALGVEAEQDLDAVAGPLGDLSWGHSPVEPGR